MDALLLTVVDSQPRTSALQRIVLTGEGLNRIPGQHAGLHIKLFFKKPDQAVLTLPTNVDGKVQWPEAALKPIARTYSVAAYDRDRNELSVDFVLHDAPGPASEFARLAKPGDIVGLAGPGPKPLVNINCSSAVLFGDLSALPAIAANAETLAAEQLAHVFLSLDLTADVDTLIRQYFPTTADKVRVFPQTFGDVKDALKPVLETLLELSPTQTSVTLAGEHSSVVYLRSHLREAGFAKDNLYAVPYWRHQHTEESYHAERHNVMDN